MGDNWSDSVPVTRQTRFQLFDTRPRFLPTTAAGSDRYYHLHFAAEETEAREGSITCREATQLGSETGGLNLESVLSPPHHMPTDNGIPRSSRVLGGDGRSLS